jgi:hypothetical protein
MNRKAVIRGVIVLGLGLWAAQQFATGHTANGAWILTFAVLILLSFTSWLPSQFRPNRLHLSQGSALHGVLIKIVILTLASLVLSIAEFTGLVVREDRFRGVLAALACLVGVYMTAWIARDSRNADKSQE